MVIFILITLSQLTISINPNTLPACGTYTPAQWFNEITNDQITLEFGTPPLNSDIVIPYLYGCKPKTAKSATQTLNFGYTPAGLLSYCYSPTSSVNVTYFQPPNDTNYYFFSATYKTNTAVTLNTFTDSNQRIVTIETSAFYNSGQVMKRDLSTYYKSEGFLKRNILAPLGDLNYYYQGPYLYLASTLNVAWNGIEQVTYLYNYLLDGNNRRVAMNVTTQLFQDPPFYITYDFHYTTNGLIDYYCVNSCNSAKVVFGYDSLNRLVNTTSGLETLLSIMYDPNGNAVTVQSGGVVWTLTY